MNLYLDMDDVVADWMGLAKSIVNRDWNYGERIPESDWNKVKTHPHFYRNLPLKEDAKELVAYCKRLLNHNRIDSLQFLTALPHQDDVPDVIEDKYAWADEHFPGINVLFGPYSFDKWKHCKPGDILIDDRGSNCEQWRGVGGLAFQYKNNWPECREWLEVVCLSRQN